MRSGLRLMLAALCAAAVANIYYAQPLLEIIGTDLGLPTRRLGVIVAIGQVGYLAGLLLLVPLGDLVNRRTLITVHLGAAAVGTGLVSFAARPVWLFVGMAVTGLFSVVVQIVVAYSASISPPAERGRDLGVVTGGVVIGIILARTVSGVVADAAGWRTVYAGSTVLLLLFATATLLILPSETRVPAEDQDRRLPTRRRYLMAVAAILSFVLVDRSFRYRAAITYLLFASFGVLWSGLALPLAAPPWNLSAGTIGAFGIAGLAGALGAVRAGRWADAGRGERVTGVALVLLVLAWVFIGQAGGSLVLLAIGIVVLDFAVQAVHVVGQHAAVAGREESSSRVIGGYMVFYSLGSATGAITATVAYGAAGWGGVSLLGGGYAVAALVGWLLGRSGAPLTQPDRRPTDAVVDDDRTGRDCEPQVGTGVQTQLHHGRRRSRGEEADGRSLGAGGHDRAVQSDHD